MVRAARFCCANAANGTGRAMGRGVIIFPGATPACNSARTATECKHMRPPHHPMPGRALRLIALSEWWPLSSAERTSDSSTFSQRQTTVSSVAVRHSATGTTNVSRTTRAKRLYRLRTAIASVSASDVATVRTALAAAAPTIVPSLSATSAPRRPAVSPAAKSQGSDVRPSSSVSGSQNPPSGSCRMRAPAIAANSLFAMKP